MSVLLVRSDREYLCERGEELQTDLGVLTVPEDAAAGDVVETHLGEEFAVRRPRGPDLFDHLERTGAPMLPRDVGLVMGHTGVGGGDRVLDAGTGTGILAIYLGRAGAEVVSYERDPEFAEVARENVAVAGVAEQVEVRTGDLTEVLADDAGSLAADDAEGLGDDAEGLGDGAEGLGDDAGFDVLTLDTEDAPTVVESAPDLLVGGGFVAVYSPFVEGTREVVEAAHEVGLSEIRTFETIQREMDFGERGSRPSTAGVGHTGYLTFGRVDGV